MGGCLLLWSKQDMTVALQQDVALGGSRWCRRETKAGVEWMAPGDGFCVRRVQMEWIGLDLTKESGLEVSLGDSFLEWKQSYFIKVFPLGYDSFLFWFPGIESRGADAVVPSPEGRVAGWICCLSNGRFIGWWQVGVSTSKGWARCDWQAGISKNREQTSREKRSWSTPWLCQETLTVQLTPSEQCQFLPLVTTVSPSQPRPDCPVCVIHGMGQGNHAHAPQGPPMGQRDLCRLCEFPSCTGMQVLCEVS